VQRKQKWPLPLIPLIFAGMMWQSGCGYQFVADSSLLPKDARTLYVETFVNRSRDVGLEQELASAMRGEFYRRGPLKVVDQPNLADVIVSGVIRPFENTVASVNQYDEVLQYSTVMIVDLTVRQREPNVILWRGDAIRIREFYAGSRAAVCQLRRNFAPGHSTPRT